MQRFLCISIHLLCGTFHGRRDDGNPEWPPSPLRVYQALVAAAAGRWKQPEFSNRTANAFEWLEQLEPPDIFAPMGWETARQGYRLYVPNNAGDLVTRAWANGNSDASMASHRTEKDVRPTRRVDHQAESTVHFAWCLPDDFPIEGNEAIRMLECLATNITHLGWGIDMASGHAKLVDETTLAELTKNEKYERWGAGLGGTPLRVPIKPSSIVQGTFRALVRRHISFTNRMADGVPHDVPPLTAYSIVEYQRPADCIRRPYVAFELRSASDGRHFASFNTRLKTRDVAGMLRNAVDRVTAAAGWSDDERAAIVHGHVTDANRPARGEGAEVRFSYLPIPSIELRGDRGRVVGDIRRVLVVAHPSVTRRLGEIEHRLSGAELRDLKTGEVKAVLRHIPTSDQRLNPFCEQQTVWSTVTPVVLPGHEDSGNLRRRLNATHDVEQQRRLLARLDRRIDSLVRRAMRQAGYPDDLVENAELEWSKVGFQRGVEHAGNYITPRELALPRYHVRLKWPLPVAGPLVFGAGRFRGFGLFASEER